MATEEALKEEQDAPQLQEKAQRERSTILFPYQDLGDAMKVAKGVHTLGGSSCQTDQLAAQLGHTATSGAFQQRLNTARIFGLLTNSRGMATLTMLGTQIVDTLQQRTAKVDAFLNVPLYKKVYEHFKGASLPPPSGLEATFVGFGVSPKQKETARRVFYRSAELSGFFEIAKDRLTYPSLRGGETAPVVLSVEDNAHVDVKKSGNGGGDGGNQHPLIEGLLKELPEPKTEWPMEERKNWLEMASTIFNVIYKNSDDSRGSLRVVVEKASAK